MLISIGQGTVTKEDAVGQNTGSGQQGKDADRHRTRVASHTAVPMGTAKWLGKQHHIPGTLPLGKGQEQHMSPTQGQAILLGAIPYQPFRKT